jgi:hypothetical protein
MATRADRLDDRRGRLKYLAIDNDVVDVIVHALRPDVAQEFLNELLAAIAQAKNSDDVTPINDVIEAWYRTMLFVKKPGFKDALAKAIDPERERFPRPVEDVLRRKPN